MNEADFLSYISCDKKSIRTNLKKKKITTTKKVKQKKNYFRNENLYY